MKNLMIHALGAALLILPIVCKAYSGIGDVIVTEHEGQPCFAIKDEPVSELYRVYVDDRSTAPPSPIWVADVDPDQALKLLGGCVVYGQSFPNQSEHHVPPTALRIGQIYGVYLKAEIPGPIHGYDAEFCLVPQTDSVKPAVRQIIWNEKARRWGKEICGSQKPKVQLPIPWLPQNK